MIFAVRSGQGLETAASVPPPAAAHELKQRPGEEEGLGGRLMGGKPTAKDTLNHNNTHTWHAGDTQVSNGQRDREQSERRG